MDRKQLNAKGLVRASTVLEVVIAMTIIVIVFGIAMMIYENVMRMSLSVQQLKARHILKEQLLKVAYTDSLANNTFQIDSLTVNEKVTDTLNGSHLKLVVLEAYDRNHQKITELKQVIIHE